jgi:hypothetical protein
MDAWTPFAHEYRRAHATDPLLRYALQRECVIRFVAFLKENGRAFPFGTRTIRTDGSTTELQVGPSIRYDGLQGGFLSRRGDGSCPYGGWIFLDADYQAMPALVATAAGVFKHDGAEYTIVGDPTSAAAQINHVLADQANACLKVNYKAVNRTVAPLCIYDNFASIHIENKVKSGDEIVLSYGYGYTYFKEAPASCDWCFGKDGPGVNEVLLCPSEHCYHKRGYHRRCWETMHGTSMEPSAVVLCELCDKRKRDLFSASHQRVNLLVGLPPYKVSLQAQRANLVAFEAAHAAEFGAMRYEPWTAAPRGGNFGKAIDVRFSQIVRGILGVFPAQMITVAQRSVTHGKGGCDRGWHFARAEAMTLC